MRKQWNSTLSFYWYDQHGRRIAKQENSLLTLYIWDGMDIIATAHADGTLREYFTRGIGIAGDVGSLVAETRFSGGTATTTYLHSNWRGDVVMATDTSGNVVGEYAYTTFGEQFSATGTYTPRFCSSTPALRTATLATSPTPAARTERTPCDSSPHKNRSNKNALRDDGCCSFIADILGCTICA
ncbi:MAG TPA: hypothetical protein P5026_07200 [Kiritimatiellia bacterium]|nr:hypothetical protein [Kiritimatiellia bacterium]